jgi:hypothetical protein
VAASPKNPAPAARSLAAAGLAFLVVLALGLGRLAYLGQPGGTGLEDPLAGRIPDGAALVVLGNSVARSAVDPQALQGALGLPVGDLILQGSQPAHWLAALRHRVFGAGHRPTVVLLYAPPQSLLGVRLVAEVDQGLLLTLLSGPDPDLVRRALGESLQMGPLPLLLRGRERARRRLLAAAEGLGAPPVALGPDPLALLPADPDARFQVLPGAPSAGQVADRDPAPQTPDRSWLPDLLAEVEEGGAQLWVIQPPRRPGEGPPPARYDSLWPWLVAQGARVEGLESLDLSAEDFDSAWHLRPEAQARVSAALAARLQVSGALPAP